MGDFVLIRPEDDAKARRASSWADITLETLADHGHLLIHEVDGYPPPDSARITEALRVDTNLVCYFGHGSPDAWLTDSLPTLDGSNVDAASGKAVVAVACYTARGLGPGAVLAGAVAWFGFTMEVATFPPYRNREPIGEAIAEAVGGLAAGNSLGELQNDLVARLFDLAHQYQFGALRLFPLAQTARFFCMALAGQIAVHGARDHRPLA